MTRLKFKTETGAEGVMELDRGRGGVSVTWHREDGVRPKFFFSHRELAMRHNDRDLRWMRLALDLLDLTYEPGEALADCPSCGGHKECCGTCRGLGVV